MDGSEDRRIESTEEQIKQGLRGWDLYWPRAIAVAQAVMAIFIGLNEALGEGRPWVLGFSVVLFSGAPATRAFIELLRK